MTGLGPGDLGAGEGDRGSKKWGGREGNHVVDGAEAVQGAERVQGRSRLLAVWERTRGGRGRMGRGTGRGLDAVVDPAA